MTASPVPSPIPISFDPNPLSLGSQTVGPPDSTHRKCKIAASPDPSISQATATYHVRRRLLHAEMRLQTQCWNVSAPASFLPMNVE